MRLASRTQWETSTARSGWHIHHVAQDLIKQGDKIILLTVGDSDFPSPPQVIEAMVDSVRRGRTHYTESAGTLELRQAIARRHCIVSGQQVSPDQVIVTVGAQNALLTAALCLLDPGDEVIVPEPMYSTYPGTIAAAGGRSVSTPCSPREAFHPSIEDMEQAVGPDTRAIFLATPNNPTGAVYTADELNRIADICRRNDLWLVSDEVYASLVYEGQHISPCTLLGMGDRTITIGSLSKSHAMAGWRLGWMIAPQTVAIAASRLSGYSTYGIPTFIQDAAIVALAEEPHSTSGLKEAYERRRSHLCESLSGVPRIQPLWPEGGMFVMLDITQTGLSAYDFADKLLHQKHVAVLPADAFGQSSAGYLRINLGSSDSDIEVAAIRIADFARELAADQIAEVQQEAVRIG